LKQIAAAIGGLYLVGYCVRQRHFSDFGREVGALGGPIAERRAKTVCGQIITSQAAQQHQKRHVAERPSFPAPRKPMKAF